jgi:hypothetical protein
MAFQAGFDVPCAILGIFHNVQFVLRLFFCDPSKWKDIRSMDFLFSDWGCFHLGVRHQIMLIASHSAAMKINRR